MHLAMTLNPFEDTDLLYAQQLGVDRIVGDVPAWDFETLAAARNRVEKAGLVLSALASLPVDLVTSALADGPEGAQALDRIGEIIADAGKLGIPCLGYGWFPASAGAPAGTVEGRGGASSAIYRVQIAADATQGERRARMWQALTRFLERAVPAAEAAGVRLAYRTDVALASLPPDARILDSVAELDRLFEIAASPNHGLDLDHGFVTRVLGAEAGLETAEVIRHFGKDTRIFAVRLRNLQPADQGAREHFLDEDKVAILRALQAYREVGFEGSLCPIPSPAMTDDTAWRHKGYAFSTGYLRALLQALA